MEVPVGCGCHPDSPGCSLKSASEKLSVFQLQRLNLNSHPNGLLNQLLDVGRPVGRIGARLAGTDLYLRLQRSSCRRRALP